MARNNRQHKKLHSGAHQKMGFEVELNVAKSFDDIDVIALMDDFLFNAIECNGLVCGGGWGGNGSRAHFVVDKLRPQKKYPWKFVSGSATEDDRHNVEVWLKAQSLVVSYKVGPLFDLWEDPEESNGKQAAKAWGEFTQIHGSFAAEASAL